MLQGISRVFLHLSSSLQTCYEIYAVNFPEANSFLNQLIETSPSFRKFLDTAEKK